ncbi:DUF436 family protein, partial [Staphylococcus saprophyticus]|uniref:DUF436 family protein n=1 Tax=Staphylococcus saprophyticus TaxID=29385 RepID=UPI0011A4E33B
QTPQFNPLTIQQVTLVPHLHPGATLPTYPYNHIHQPILLQHISLPKPIHIPQTLIPIHINHLPIPQPTTLNQIPQAILTIPSSTPNKIPHQTPKYN